jgi:hypothetical protein
VQRTRLKEEFEGMMRSMAIKEENSRFPPSRICSLLVKVIDPDKSKLIIGVTGG